MPKFKPGDYTIYGDWLDHILELNETTGQYLIKILIDIDECIEFNTSDPDWVSSDVYDDCARLATSAEVLLYG